MLHQLTGEPDDVPEELFADPSPKARPKDAGDSQDEIPAGRDSDTGEAMLREVEQSMNRGRRADHWIYLDRSWAQRLGVKRTDGRYRIRSRELVRRLSREHLGVDASGTICVPGNATVRGPAADQVTAMTG